MKKNPWHPRVQAALKRTLPRSVYLRWVGRHEKGSLAVWMRLARGVPRERAILDIGAYHGEYALAAREANPIALVYAFEPSPESNGILRQICSLNDITLEEIAVAERSETVHLMLDGQRSQISDKGVPIRALSLDDWRAMRDAKPALVKIDTEGAEAAIIRGASSLIREFRPTILCEVLSDDAGRNVMDVLSDYRYHRIDEDRGLEERQRITREHWRHKNWLLVPH